MPKVSNMIKVRGHLYVKAAPNTITFRGARYVRALNENDPVFVSVTTRFGYYDCILYDAIDKWKFLLKNLREDVQDNVEGYGPDYEYPIRYALYKIPSLRVFFDTYRDEYEEDDYPGSLGQYLSKELAGALFALRNQGWAGIGVGDVSKLESIGQKIESGIIKDPRA